MSIKNNYFVKTFSLEDAAFTQMTVQILSAISTIKNYNNSEQVQAVASYFINTRSELTTQLYPELYFVMDMTNDSKVLDPINKSVDEMSSNR